MSRTPRVVGPALEKALDPLATALKRATRRGERTSPPAGAAPPAATPGKPGLQVSPLAVRFPTIPAFGGV